MMLEFWDIAPILYCVGLVIAFVLVFDRLARPNCYRIPFALFVAAFWPIAVIIAVMLYVEGVLCSIKDWIIGED
jgi:hypothetical protein